MCARRIFDDIRLPREHACIYIPAILWLSIDEKTDVPTLPVANRIARG